MANREIRQSKHNCPKCEVPLREIWVYGPDGGITGGQDWQQQGRATCPAGHRIDWTAAGTPA